MPLVSPDVAEQAWKRVGALDEAAALELQQRSGTFQPELVGFVLGFIHNLSPEAMGIALYATLVVFEMFQRAVPRIKKVKERTIVRLWHENRRAVLLRCAMHVEHQERAGERVMFSPDSKRRVRVAARGGVSGLTVKPPPYLSPASRAAAVRAQVLTRSNKPAPTKRGPCARLAAARS